MKILENKLIVLSNKKMKTYIFILLALIIGIFIEKYLFKDIPTIDEIKVENSNTMHNKIDEINIQKDTGINTIIYKLPEFVTKDLAKYSINSDNLDEYDWNTFLEKIKKQSIESFSTKQGNSFFHLLMSNSNIDFETIDELLSQGLNINQINKYGETPIMLALKNSNLNISDIEKLLEKGAYLDEKSINYTLKNSNITQKENIMNYLKEQGFKLDKEEYFSDANSLENRQYLKELLQNIDINFKVKDSLSSFESVLMANQDNEIIEYYLNNGVKLDENDGFSVLHAISKNENISLENIQKIIDSGGDINEPTSKVLMTPLMTFIANNGENNVEKIKLLLENGANISKTNFLGKSAYDFLQNIKNEEKREEIKNLLDKYNN
ncbi:hypothetical protein CRU92_03905 [Arcobacter sp. FW59]|nr:hypothetical protein CRU92_03905 [Arcobacter sp. FW59]